MNIDIVFIIITSIVMIVITQLFRILGAKIERLKFKTWLIKNNLYEFLKIYSKYEKGDK